MCCVFTPTFVVLINGVASSFFKASQGLQKGCPMSPYLFLLVVEGLDRSLLEAQRIREVQGVHIERKALSHLLFVDDVLLFLFGSEREGFQVKEILELFKLAIGMEVNKVKSTLFTSGLEEVLGLEFGGYFPFKQLDLNAEFKYLGFNLKPNCLGWLISKIEKKIKLWCTRWLSRGGGLVLIKGVV
jgi:hypothetical protein